MQWTDCNASDKNTSLLWTQNWSQVKTHTTAINSLLQVWIIVMNLKHVIRSFSMFSYGNSNMICQPLAWKNQNTWSITLETCWQCAQELSKDRHVKITSTASSPCYNWLDTRIPFSWHRWTVARCPNYSCMLTENWRRRGTLIKNHMMYQCFIFSLNQRFVLNKLNKN